MFQRPAFRSLPIGLAVHASRISTTFFTGLALIALYAVAVDVRRTVWSAQPSLEGESLPFTLESALHFRLLELVDLTGRLPDHDPMIEFPDGVDISRTYSVGAEFICVPLARLLPASLSFQERIRWVQVLWFSMGACWMALWAGWAFRSRWGGVFAGLFYAVMIASVMRSTGQEISRENFALPLAIAFFALDAGAERMRSFRGKVAVRLAAAGMLAAAMMTWDLVQYVVALWTAAMLVGAARRAFRMDLDQRLRWWLPWGALMWAGMLHPYLRAHAFAASPVMLAGAGLAAALALEPFARRKHWPAPRWSLLGITLLPVLIALLVPGLYGEAYGHFGELLSAKLQFLNKKPADPTLLTFNQRIMWVPALHSANWMLVRMVFPATLWLTCGAVLLCCWPLRESPANRPLALAVYFTISLITFIFFVRFHVFVAVFGAGLLGWMASWAVSRQGWRRWLTLTLLGIGLFAEAFHTLDNPTRWGRHNVYYREMDELVDWLSEQVAPEPVLANFGVSGSILGYAGCPIVLHPKFETAAIRKRVQSYGEALFKGDEKTFRDWADQFGVRYYVYSLGEFARQNPELQMRYFVDALTPPPEAAARLFERRPDEGRYFRMVWHNRKYRVFRMVTGTDEKLAMEEARKAEEAFQRGELDAAEFLTTEALRYDPACQEAMRILQHIGSLREMGFKSETSSP